MMWEVRDREQRRWMLRLIRKQHADKRGGGEPESSMQVS